MNITESAGSDWRQWVCVTSIPLVHLGKNEDVLGLGSGMMINHAGSRFLLAAEHVVKRDATGWAVVVQQGDNEEKCSTEKNSAFRGNTPSEKPGECQYSNNDLENELET